MKKNLLAISFCCLYLVATAQLQLLRSEMLPFGAIMTEKSVLNLSVIDTSIQGANAVWNFSALKNDLTVPDLIATVLNPTTTTYGSNFPSSSYCYKEKQGTEVSYSYFNLTDTKQERIGSYYTNLCTYSDPQIELVFPLGLGTYNDDTWANSNSTFGGEYNLKCIGTGKLTIPGGSYNAVLVRVHSVELFDENSYYWYSSDNGAILLFYTTGDGIFTGEDARYMSSLSLGVDDEQLIHNIEYNNPVQNNFRFHFQSKTSEAYSYSVMNTMGQQVLDGILETVSGNNESIEIDFTGFATGVYFLQLKSEKNDQLSKSIKIIKQ